MSGIVWLVWLAVKPLPVLYLATLAFRAAPDRYARLVAAGLLLSAGADLLIEWRFLAGLVCFLAAHLVYTAAFWTDVAALRPLRAAGFLGFAVAMLLVLGPRLGVMALPVVAYVAAICTMMWRAAARVGSTPRGARSAWFALAGALTFAASDALIGIDTFHARIPGAAYLIMILYWLGQTGIALSARRTE